MIAQPAKKNNRLDRRNEVGSMRPPGTDESWRNEESAERAAGSDKARAGRVWKGSRFRSVRRGVCALIAGFMTAALSNGGTGPQPAHAGESGAPAPVQLPLRLVVASSEGQPVVTDKWLEEQVAEANRVIGAHGVTFAAAQVHHDATMTAKLENRADRNRLGDLVQKKVINVFVVASLRDVDDPALLRMGVHWRQLSNLKNNYIIVSASARRATLAHEIGHYLGNPHTSVENNLMSYKRTDEEAVFLNASQGARCRATASFHLASGKLELADDKSADKRPSKG